MTFGPCLCGDTHCPSCGPAQGNSKCDHCGEWMDDHEEHLDEETGKVLASANCRHDPGSCLRASRLAYEAEAHERIQP